MGPGWLACGAGSASGASGQTQSKKDYVSLSVDKDGYTYFDKEKIALEEVLPRLRKIYATNPEAKIFIRGDREAVHGNVTRVLDQMDPGALKRVISEADTALPDPTTVLPNLSRASILLNNTAHEMNGRGRLLLGNFQTLLANAEWVNPILTSLTPPVREIGHGIQDFFKHIPTSFEPGNISNLNKLVARIQNLLDDRGADLKVLGEAFQPKLNAIAASLMNFDTGQLLDNLLQEVPADGTITLRVTP